MVHRLSLIKGEIAIAPIHRAAGGVDQVVHAVMAAALENVPEADQIALDVGGRILEGVANPSLSSQIHHFLGLCRWKAVSMASRSSRSASMS